MKKMDQLENLVSSQSEQITSLSNAIVDQEVQTKKLQDKILQKLLDLERHSREYNVQTKNENSKKLIAQEIHNKKLFQRISQRWKKS